MTEKDTYHIKLTMHQRIGLSNVLGAQSNEPVDALMVFYDVRKRLQVPDKLRDEYIKWTGPVPGWDYNTLTIAPGFEIDLQLEEFRRVKRLIDTYNQFNVRDLEDWVLNLREKLNEAESVAKKDRHL